MENKILTLIATRNSLKLMVPFPSLSKCFKRAAHCSSFKLIPMILKPPSSSPTSRFLFLFRSICLNVWASPRIDSEFLLTRVSLMSLTSYAPSYDKAWGAATGSAAFGSVAVKIYQILLSCGFFWARLMTFLPTDSPYNYWPLCFSTILLALTSSSYPNWFE